MEITGLGNYLPTTDSTTLSEEQKKKLQEILASYDPENMTADDRSDLLQDLKDAGIPRCQDALDMMRLAGFKAAKKTDSTQTPSLLDADQDQTGVQNGELWTAYQKFQSGEITEDEFLSQIKVGIASGSLINYIS